MAGRVLFAAKSGTCRGAILSGSDSIWPRKVLQDRGIPRTGLTFPVVRNPRNPPSLRVDNNCEGLSSATIEMQTVVESVHRSNSQGGEE